MSGKSELRAGMRAARRALKNRENLSIALCRNILGWELFRSARKVMSYYPVDGEADVMAVNKKILDEKELYLPFIDGARILPLRVCDLSELKPGKFGIPSPSDALRRACVSVSDMDLILVPGVLFDRVGWRIGFGGGYYDRALQNCKVVHAGVCFDMQVSPSVEHILGDVRMDFIITEKGISKVNPVRHGRAG